MLKLLLADLNVIGFHDKRLIINNDEDEDLEQARKLRFAKKSIRDGNRNNEKIKMKMMMKMKMMTILRLGMMSRG